MGSYTFGIFFIHFLWTADSKQQNVGEVLSFQKKSVRIMKTHYRSREERFLLVIWKFVFVIFANMIVIIVNFSTFRSPSRKY